MTAEEKAYLRGVLPPLIAQEDSQIAVQVALAIAKAARHDYPREWPSLLADLVAQADGGGTLAARRAPSRGASASSVRTTLPTA